MRSVGDAIKRAHKGISKRGEQDDTIEWDIEEIINICQHD